jgi:hypothetical protein
MIKFTVPSFSIFLVILIISFSCSSLNDSSKDDFEIDSITLDSVYLAGITNLVGENIWLTSKLEWSSGKDIWSPNNDTIYVRNLSLLFENGDNYLPDKFKGQNCGNILFSSNHLNIRANGKTQEYYYKKQKLKKGKIYQLYGYFDYRDWLEVDSTTLSNPAFIKQSNDVTYWSQTFEFDVSILK